ncbi:MAG: GNAT family N-acetyltransferase [Bacteroidia bacterium]|nr:GNAT family N-acetyltransferase [Bacteroidia bacterium]
MKFEILHTERLLLKKFSPEAFTYVFANYSKEEIKKQLGLNSEEDFIREQKKAEGGYRTYDRSIAHFKLILKETGQVIGGAGFHNWYAMHKRAEIGYMMYKEDFRRKGYMEEAVRKILDYGFNTMELMRIEATISPTNDASLNLIRKFGFKQEGLLRNHYIHEGIIQDSVIFGLLKEEYST